MNKELDYKTIADISWIVLLIIYFLIKCNVFYSELIEAAVSAALIGGVADWFAVKALFEKICLFNHSNILIKKRKVLTKSMVEFATKDLMTADNINSIISKINISNLIILYLNKYNGKERILEISSATIKSMICEMDFGIIIRKMESEIKLCIKNGGIERNVVDLAQEIINSRHSEKIMSAMIKIGKDIYNQPEFQMIINDQIKKITSSYDEKSFGRETARGLVFDNDKIIKEINNVVNRKFDELENDNNKVYEKIKCDVDNYLRSSSFMSILIEKKDEMIIDDNFIEWLIDNVNKYKNDNQLEIAQKISTFIENQINLFITDAQQQKILDSWIKNNAYDFVTKKHNEISNIFYDKLNEKSDGDYLKEIKDNAGNNIQSIRFSGMIVGGIVGMLCYLVRIIFDKLWGLL